MADSTIRIVSPTRPRYAVSRRQKDWLWALLFVGPQLLGLLAFAIFPLAFGFALSLMEWDGLGTREWVGLANFRDQLGDAEFRTAFRNTLYYTLLTVPTGLGLALLTALGVNKVRGRTLYRALYFAPVITSSVAISVVWQYLLNGDFGILNAYLHDWFGLNPPNWLADTRFVMPAIALVGLWWSLGLNMVIFLAGLQNIPPTLQEAALVDGANRFQVFRDITLPLLTPTIFFSIVVAIIFSFQAFDQIFVLTNGGPLDASRTLVFHVYDLAFRDFAFGQSSAAAVLLFVTLLAVTLLQFAAQRRWVHDQA
jgi:multiple sugar transport system permease protein